MQLGLAIALSLMLVGWAIDLASGTLTLQRVPLAALASRMPLGTRLASIGVLALGLTPVARVVILGTAWAVSGQGRLALIAASVLAVLSASFVAGVLGFGTG